MSSATRLDLGSIWLFSTCSATQLRAIRRSVDDVEVPADRILCSQGTPGLEFWFIVEGTAAVRRNNRVVARLGPGQHFGELALLDRQPRSATVTSTSPMRLLRLEQERFDALVDTVPALAGRLMTALAARLRDADRRAFG